MQAIFDAHIHLWNLNKVDISWLENDESLKQDYEFKDLQKQYQDFDFLGGLYVEVNSDDKAKEALFALELQRLYKLELCLADLLHKEQICAFREVMHTSKNGAKRLFDEDFKIIALKLIEHDLAFEACVKSEHLSLLVEFLKQNPKLKVVLNHLGSLGLSDLKVYEENLKALASFSKVYVKISALDGFCQDTPKDFIFTLFHLAKKYFGEQRLIYGSNYPVAKLSPKEWIALIKQSKVFKDLDALFYKNALRIYKGK
ncbi:amidohydrolase [Campylobacter sp. MIT 12-5580]|uniref:amidohydrolase family protein n=1 Tax=Campylobacter sp. MIT 12-5580 TaxID=2040651 RepID=UPI0010F84F9E|nr:amidohydrolase family protein [Campylobacter sp. MIT 12-5580]TKX29432.1 amidohydrolase [Campylobacter sp. MIT 12-5580]